jgi:hypothetical protein
MFLTLTRTSDAKVTINMEHVVSFETTKAGSTIINLIVEAPDKHGFRKPRTITVKEDQGTIARIVGSKAL